MSEYKLPSDRFWSAKGNVVPGAFVPLHDAYVSPTLQWRDEELESIAKAMVAWRGIGHMEAITVQQLKNHRTTKPLGPPYSSKRPKEGPPRWKTAAAVITTARLVKSHVGELQSRLHIDEPMEAVPTMASELKDARERVDELEERVTLLTSERVTSPETLIARLRSVSRRRTRR